MLRDGHRTAPRAGIGLTRHQLGFLPCFQRIALDCLQAIQRLRLRAISGNPEAVHRIRVELTRLRAAALFFAPAMDPAGWSHIDHELRWLNSSLGKARNRDVALEALARMRNRRRAARARRNLLRSRDKAYRRLTRKLGSARYIRLTSELDRWLSRLSSPGTDQSQQFDQIDARLREWRNEISRKGRHLRSLRRKPLHRLRIRSKHYRYMVEALLKLDIPVSREDYSFCEIARRVHQTLGDLRDLKQFRRAVGRRPPHYRKRKRKLMRRAAASFRHIS